MTVHVARSFIALLIGVLVMNHAYARERTPRLVYYVGGPTTIKQLASSNSQLRANIDVLRTTARESGSVRVALKVAVPFAPEELLSDVERVAQRREIAEAFQEIRSRLPSHIVLEQQTNVPYILATLTERDFAIVENTKGLEGISELDRFNWLRDYTQARTNQAGARLLGTKTHSNSNEPPAQRIVGGTKASPSTHPFQVGLLTKSVSDNFNAQFCGGTLVADRYVVTAAHCSDSVTASTVQVLVGTQRLDGSGQRIDVTRIAIHPNWNQKTWRYDVAVWELSQPVTGLSFASLATTQPTVAGTPLRATGWGSVAYQGAYPIDLQQVDVPFVPTVRNSCQSQRGITPEMICAGTDGKDSCQGDSGGPLTMNNGSGYTVLAGIVSFGSGCGSYGYPGVYANIAATSIYSFIQSNIGSSPQPANTIQFATAVVSAGEAQRVVLLTVTRSSGVGTASVRYAAMNDTAVSPSDYALRSGTLKFRKNQTNATIRVSIKNDKIREGLESFYVVLDNASAGYAIGAERSATITIADND